MDLKHQVCSDNDLEFVGGAVSIDAMSNLRILFDPPE